MILIFIGFVFQGMSSFKEYNPSISKFVLPLFPNSYEGEKTCQPLLVYQRRPTILPLLPDHSLDVDPTFQPEPTPLRRSTRDHKLPEKYSYSKHLSLTTTLAYVPIPSSY